MESQDVVHLIFEGTRMKEFLRLIAKGYGIEKIQVRAGLRNEEIKIMEGWTVKASWADGCVMSVHVEKILKEKDMFELCELFKCEYEKKLFASQKRTSL